MHERRRKTDCPSHPFHVARTVSEQSLSSRTCLSTNRSLFSSPDAVPRKAKRRNSQSRRRIRNALSFSLSPLLSLCACKCACASVFSAPSRSTTMFSRTISLAPWKLCLLGEAVYANVSLGIHGCTDLRLFLCGLLISPNPSISSPCASLALPPFLFSMVLVASYVYAAYG